MISKTAMEDIAALGADGIEVPPREVVRLNALGLRVDRGADSAALSEAPRVAFLGDAVLREPTLGSDMWLRQAFDVFDCDDAETYHWLLTLTCAVPWRDLPDPTDRRAVKKAVREVQRRLGDATLRQLSNALEWCTCGNAPETGEEPPPRASEDDGADEPPARYAPEFGLFIRGAAARIGTAADMKDMTTSAMIAACDRAEKLATAAAGGGADRKAEENKAFGDYMRALDAVKAAAQRGAG